MITHIHHGCGDGGTCASIEHEAHWIGLTSNGERMNFQRRLLRSDAWADLKHMCAKDLHATVLVQVIRVIFHKRGATLQASTHYFHRTQQGRGLPVTLGTKAIALGHQALHSETGQLGEAMEILKIGGECLKIAFLQKMPYANLNTRTIAQGLVLATTMAQRGCY